MGNSQVAHLFILDPEKRLGMTFREKPCDKILERMWEIKNPVSDDEWFDSVKRGSIQEVEQLLKRSDLAVNREHKDKANRVACTVRTRVLCEL